MKGISMFNTVIISFQADTCLPTFQYTKQIEMTCDIVFFYLRLFQDRRCNNGFQGTEEFYVSQCNWTPVSHIPGKHTTGPSKQLSHRESNTLFSRQSCQKDNLKFMKSN